MVRLVDAAGLPATLLRVYRPLGIARRARHEFEVRSGMARLRTSPGAGLPDDPGGRARLQAVDLGALRKGYAALPDADAVREQIVADAAKVLAGQVHFYGGRWVTVGWPPDWRRNAETGYTHDRDVHWSAVSDHDLAAGDIKDVWEPSRFGWAYTLIRAFTVTGEDHYAEAFWQGLASWEAENPPNCGPNWAGGQESSIRAVAVLFALRALGDHQSATPTRLALARRLLLATGQRVASTIGYAASQRNDHLVSEAVGLYTLGVVFASWPQAIRWRRAGWRHLRAAIADQFYPDGTYAEHSVTYQRLAVQTLCWALVVGKEAAARLPAEVCDAVRGSVRLLHALQDEASGHLPNLGSNDGGMLLQLSVCAYRDFRPALQAASLVLGDGRLYEPGPWDEEALWLAGPGGLDAEPAVVKRPARVVAPDGGLLATRGPTSMALLRVSPVWRHRPGQADDCHVDVWLGGIEVAGDAGTYRYTAPPPWDNGLAASRAHNTVTIGGGDRLRRIGRFLSTAWPHTRLLFDVAGEDWQCWVVESDVPVWQSVGGMHRRLLLRVGDRVLVGDLVYADFPHSPRVSWNLPAGGEAAHGEACYGFSGEGWSVHLAAPGGAAIHELVGSEEIDGWQSPTYGLLRKRRTVAVSIPAGAHGMIMSVFAREPVDIDWESRRTCLDDALGDPSTRRVQALATTLRPKGRAWTSEHDRSRG